MKLIFSSHANLKIRQRRILRRSIIETINQPDFVRPGYGLREERYRKYRTSYLKVVIKKENERIVIITAHWVAKVKDK